MIRGKTLRNTLLVLAALALVIFLAVSFGLFSPSSHMWPSRVEDGKLYYTRHNCTLAYTPGEGSALLKLPWDRGGGEAPDTYTVGERSFALSEDGTQLLENGENLVPEGLGLFASRLNAQPDSLIVPLSDARGNEAGWLCLTTDHSRVLNSAPEPLCAAGRWAYGVEPCGDGAQLCCIDLETGETWPLTDELGVSLALTDGRWLYTYRMWGTGSASCWEIARDAEGRPEALDYVGEV